MNFDWTEEQQQLIDSVSRLLEEKSSFRNRGARLKDGAALDRELWDYFVEVGLTALPIAEDDGGLGGSASDLLAVGQTFGKFMVTQPWFSSCVIAAKALSLGSPTEERQALLKGVTAGTMILAWAHADPEADGEVQPKASQTSEGQWHITGTKDNVVHAPSAGIFIVTARAESNSDRNSSVGLFLVDAKDAGVSVEPYALLDDTPAGTVRFTHAGARALELAAGANAADCIRTVEAYGILSSCALLLGAAQEAYDLTRAYLGTRSQFGRTLSQNQALRHMAAEMLVSLETIRSMAMLAAIAMDFPDHAKRELELSRAKFLVGKHARLVCQAAIQMHGAIGFTVEHAVGHYLRMVMVLDQMHGTPQTHAMRLRRMEHPVESKARAHS